jgi:hypothetical protein
LGVRFALLASLLLAAPAMGQIPAPRLTWRWSGAPACPDPSAVEAEVVRLLGGEIPEGPPLTVTAEVGETDGLYRVALQTESAAASGERVLEGPDCAELGGAVALVVALLVDPAAVEETALDVEAAPVEAPVGEEVPPEISLSAALAVPDAPVAAAASESASDVAAPPAARPARAEAPPAEAPPRPPVPRTRRLGVGLGGRLDLQTLPENAVTPGLRLDGRVAFGPLFALRARVGWLAEQGVAFDAPEGANASFWLLDGTVLGCGVLLDETLFVDLCGGVAAGGIRGASDGVSAPDQGVGLLVAVLGGAAVGWRPAPWLALELTADLAVHLTRPSFIVEGVGAAAVPEVGGRVGLSARVRP